MNYKFWGATLILAAALNAAGICETDYHAVYSETLDGYYKLVSSPRQDVTTLEEEEYGVWEVTMGSTPKEAMERVGYAIRDISGDGIPELIIGSAASSEYKVNAGTMLYAVYTCVNGKPKLSFEGRARSSYSPLKNGKFLYRGSSGAIYSIFGIYDISRDGTQLVCQDYYFTYEKDKDYKNIGMFHNKTGAWDKAQSQEMSGSLDYFWKMLDNLAAQTQEMKLTHFSQYKKAAARKSARLKAELASNLPSNIACDKFTADNSSSKVSVVFTTDKTVKKFRVLSLSLKDVNSAGKPVFEENELYRRDALTPELPLCVDMVFYGDIPNNGIAYIDANGMTRKFAVSLSGRDGSVVLVEY